VDVCVCVCVYVCVCFSFSFILSLAEILHLQGVQSINSSVSLTFDRFRPNRKSKKKKKNINYSNSVLRHPDPENVLHFTLCARFPFHLGNNRVSKSKTLHKRFHGGEESHILVARSKKLIFI
jgi:hypothetical protein